MTFLRSLLFNLYFYLLTTVMALAGLPLLAMPWRWTMRYSRLWTQLVLLGLKLICRLDYRIVGRERLPDGPCLIACKHQSAWETMVLPNIALRFASCVMKRELLFLPVFGWYLRHSGQIPIDRRGGAKALKDMLVKARETIDDGRPIVIFPEGTRTAPGQQRPYHVGVAALYKSLKVPVVPVALNSGLFWSRQAFHKRAGTITVEFLPPIPPGLSRDAFMTELRDRIENASQRLAEQEGHTTTPSQPQRQGLPSS